MIVQNSGKKLLLSFLKLEAAKYSGNLPSSKDENQSILLPQTLCLEKRITKLNLTKFWSKLKSCPYHENTKKTTLKTVCR